VSITASILTIVALSFDRYLAINHPVRSRRLSTPRNVRLVLCGIWGLAALSMLPLCLVRVLEEHPLSKPGGLVFCHEQWTSSRLRNIFDVFVVVFIYVVPSGAVIALYSATGRHLLRSGSSLRRQDSSMASSGRVMASRRRVARMLVTLAAMFVVSWLPYHLVILYMDFVQRKFQDSSLVALSFALLVGHSHSAQNPVLYCLMNTSFRRGLLKTLQCKSCKTEATLVRVSACSGRQRERERERERERWRGKVIRR
jgi:hypothetical protein